MRPPSTVVEQPIVLRRSTSQRPHRADVAVYDVDGSLVLGDTLLMETVNGRLTGRLAGPNCRGERKADRVRLATAGESDR